MNCFEWSEIFRRVFFYTNTLDQSIFDVLNIITPPPILFDILSKSYLLQKQFSKINSGNNRKCLLRSTLFRVISNFLVPQKVSIAFIYKINQFHHLSIKFSLKFFVNCYLQKQYFASNSQNSFKKFFLKSLVTLSSFTQFLPGTRELKRLKRNKLKRT